MFSLRIVIVCVVGCAASQAAAKTPNIVFVAVDDLRPQVRTYGCAEAITPNMDRLAAEGVRFDRAYVTYPRCLPSRASMLTGLRLDYQRSTGRKRRRSLAELIGLQSTWPRTFREAGPPHQVQLRALRPGLRGPVRRGPSLVGERRSEMGRAARQDRPRKR